MRLFKTPEEKLPKAEANRDKARQEWEQAVDAFHKVNGPTGFRRHLASAFPGWAENCRQAALKTVDTKESVLISAQRAVASLRAQAGLPPEGVGAGANR